MDQEEREKRKREKKKRGINKKKKKEEKRKKNTMRGNLDIYYFNLTGEAVLPNVFQNGSNSIREAAPSKESEPELFLEKPEPCQTRPSCRARLFGFACTNTKKSTLPQQPAAPYGLLPRFSNKNTPVSTLPPLGCSPPPSAAARAPATGVVPLSARPNAHAWSAWR